ncbi:DNA ligase LigA-related protein [Pyruvatibacter sp.]
MTINRDVRCSEIIQSKPHMLVPWYLMASYLYYWEDISLLSDSLYDRLCKQLLDQWDSIEHRHKGLIDRESLASGTGYALLRGDYPEMTKSCAIRLAHDATF